MKNFKFDCLDVIPNYTQAKLVFRKTGRDESCLSPKFELRTNLVEILSWHEKTENQFVLSICGLSSEYL